MQYSQTQPNRRELPNRAFLVSTAKAATITIAVLALFFSDFSTVFLDALHNKAPIYVILIPLILGYVLYRKRKILLAIATFENPQQTKRLKTLTLIAGILASTTAILLYWHGSYTPTATEYHLIALPLFITGLVLILFNTNMLRQLLFQITLLSAVLLLPHIDLTKAAGGALTMAASQASLSIANAFGISSILTIQYHYPVLTLLKPSGIALQFPTDTGPSGIYGILTFAIITALIAYMSRDKPWKKAAIASVGLAILLLSSIIVMTAFIFLGYTYGVPFTMQTFSPLDSWILSLIGTPLILLIAQKALKAKIINRKIPDYSQNKAQTQTDQDFYPTSSKIIKHPKMKTLTKAKIISTTAILIAIIALISIQAPVLAFTQTSGKITVTTATGNQMSEEILPTIPAYTLQFNYRDTAYEKTVKIETYLNYLYNPNQSSLQPILVSVEIAPKTSPIPKWENYLINYPLQQGKVPSVIQIELSDIQITQPPSVTGRYFVFQSANYGPIQVVLYWTETVLFRVNSTLQEKKMQISLTARIQTINDNQQVKSQMLTIAQGIVNHFEPAKQWSLTTTAITQNGLHFAAATIILLGATVFFFLEETENAKAASNRAYKKLSEENKQIIASVHETQKITPPTLNNIAQRYLSSAAPTISSTQLLQRLYQLEKTGTVNRQIINQQDQAIITWRTPISYIKKQNPKPSITTSKRSKNQE